MKYVLRDDGQKLIPIPSIATLVISNNPKDGSVLNNFLVKAIKQGTVHPRGSNGHPVNYKQATEEIKKLRVGNPVPANPLHALSLMESFADAARIDLRSALDNFFVAAAPWFIEQGYLTQSDISSWLTGQQIACEWKKDRSCKKRLGRQPKVERLLPIIKDAARAFYSRLNPETWSAEKVINHPDFVERAFPGKDRLTEREARDVSKYTNHFGIARRTVCDAVADVRKELRTTKSAEK